MKVTLYNNKDSTDYCSNKDVSGGFGSVTRIGDSFLASLIENGKKGVDLPLVSLGYLSAILEKSGFNVSYREEGTPESDLVLMPSSIINYNEDLKAAKSISSKKIKVGAFGPFASAKPSLFSENFDFVLIGEPESAVQKMIDGEIFEGVIYGEPVDNLDSLPHPNWEPFPVDRYSYSPLLNETPFLPVQSSRGCPLSCSYYCPYPVSQGSSWRARSSEDVIEEVKGLVNKYELESLLFRDPLFSFERKRTVKIATGLKNIKNDLSWACETRTDLLDTDLIDILYESGLRALNVGIESPYKESLEKLGRKPDELKHQEKIVNYCEERGIKVSAFYILGLPGDTRETIEETIEYAKKLNAFSAQFTICTPYPGTPFFEDVGERINCEDWEEFDGYTPVFEHQNLKEEELLQLKERAFLEYYYRPRWLLKYLTKRLGLS